MDQAELEQLVQYVRNQRHYVDSGFVAAIALVLYDLALTIDREIFLIWFSPVSYTKGLFFLVRYVPILAMCLDIPNEFIIGISPKVCDWLYPLSICLLSLGVLFAEVVLLVRTWAILKRNKWVGSILALLMAGMICTACISDVKYQYSLKFATPPYPGFQGCFIVSESNTLQINFIMLAAVDFIVFSLMAYSAYRTYNQGSRNELWTIIHRDGILFYMYLLVINIVNAILMSALPTDLQQLLAPICCSLYSVLACRIVLNIRQTARTPRYGSPRLPPAELHGHADSLTTIEFSLAPIQILESREF